LKDTAFIHSSEQLFFCFGPPKSGTTFLQRTLNLHPEISCPSEHHLNFLIKNIENLFTKYNKHLLLVDKRTGGQGATLLTSETVSSIFRYTVLSIIKQSAKNKPIMGVNDNAIISQLHLYNSLFNRPKMIVIFRHPINTAISAWHHNLRLAEEENDPTHKQLMFRHGGFEDWLKVIAERFSFQVKECYTFAKKNSNMLIIRYEDLSERKIETLKIIFEFLGANYSSEILAQIATDSSIDNMRKKSKQPIFFRAGSTKLDSPEVSPQLKNEISIIAREGLSLLKYI